jgi:CelD/BcsL family acetyltransferase involved in cellulose biosynthesis
VCRCTSQRELLEVFYPLHVRTRRRLGVPVQPRRFFEVLWREFLSYGLGFVVTARISGVAVASGVFLAWNRRMVHKFAASDRPLVGNAGAGHAVVWNALRWGCETGHVELDFGRTDLGNEGLRTFKLSWGSRESELVYTVLGSRRLRPAGRGDRVLAPVIRNSPELLTRAIGRIAYRYTA